LKILQVIPYFFVDWAGGKEGKPVETAYGLSNALIRRGHKVFVYTTDAFNKTAEMFKGRSLDLNGINVCEFKSLGNRKGVFNLCISPGMIFKLKKEIQAFDIIHLHEYPTFQNGVVHHYAKKYHIPYVLQSHGSLPRTDGARGFKWLLRSLYNASFGNQLLRDASRVIASSKIEAEQYKCMGVSEDKIVIVPNGIDLSEFENLPPKGEFRKKWDIDNNQKIILFLARINIIKRPDLLVNIYAELLKEMDNIQLVITGPDDGYLSVLKQLINELGIEEKVLFTGPLYGKRKLEAYVDADIYVLPSSYEAFGITALEACACGTPVIVTDRCGIADLIDNQAGLVVSNDMDALRDAILHMLSDEKLRQEFSKKGKLLAHEKLRWEKVAEQAEYIYQNCV
jgi:glycosyltransferase involved in cell wall biosynthesis